MKTALRRTTTAFAALATVGVSGLFMGALPASAATPPADACGQGGTYLGGNVCQQTFTEGSVNFTPTAQMTKLEALLVGGGGSGEEIPSINGSTGYASAGGGGDVKIVDFSGTTATELTGTVGAAGNASTIDAGTTTTDAAQGQQGSTAGGGASGSTKAGGTGATTTAPVTTYGGGGGAAVAGDGANGGAGVVVSSIAPSGSLFSDDSDCYGGGGAVGLADDQIVGLPGCGASGPTDATTSALTVARANSGSGGGALRTSTSGGASGVVVIRWTLPTVTLSFASNGHGSPAAAEVFPAGFVPDRPADPTLKGYAFKGWYTDPQLTTLADFSAPVSADTTYYASFAALPTLAATGGAPNAVELPIGIGALVVGAGLFGAAAYRRRRRTN